jgi:hypothetical protein
LTFRGFSQKHPEWLQGDQEVVDYSAQEKWKKYKRKTEQRGLTDLRLTDYFNPGALPDSRFAAGRRKVPHYSIIRTRENKENINER